MANPRGIMLCEPVFAVLSTFFLLYMVNLLSASAAARSPYRRSSRLCLSLALGLPVPSPEQLM